MIEEYQRIFLAIDKLPTGAVQIRLSKNEPVARRFHHLHLKRQDA